MAWKRSRVRFSLAPLFGGALREGSLGHFLGGVVAGEGHFGVRRRPETFADGSPRLRFVFAIEMRDEDGDLLEALASGFGCGSIYSRPARRPGHASSRSFEVGAIADHHRATIPFARVFMPRSAKQQQFDAWCTDLLAYERNRPTQWGRGPSTCSESGCDRPVRGRGLCRSHYYRATGH
jgi:hypothetical protein